jgi:hypothetical protein
MSPSSPEEFAPLDHLSPAARAVLSIDAATAYSTLVPLGHGSTAARDAIEILNPDSVLAGPVVRRDDAQAVLAGLWLWHDYLDASHTISQSIPSATGSFWHAIMHRREGDFSNSKYWNARCRNHPAYATLATHADEIVRHAPADKSVLRVTAQGWNGDAFVDLVEALHDRPDDPRHSLAVAMQKAEWRVLFDHCVRSARGF